MEELRLDGRDMKPRPCTTCEDVINETAHGRGDESIMTWGEYALSIFDEEDTSTDESQPDLGNP